MEIINEIIGKTNTINNNFQEKRIVNGRNISD